MPVYRCEISYTVLVIADTPEDAAMRADRCAMREITGAVGAVTEVDADDFENSAEEVLTIEEE